MKALLHFRASKSLENQILEQSPSWLNLAVAAPDDHATVEAELRDTDVLFHVLAPTGQQLLSLAPKLKLIQKIGVGVNTIMSAGVKIGHRTPRERRFAAA